VIVTVAVLVKFEATRKPSVGSIFATFGSDEVQFADDRKYVAPSDRCPWA